MTILFYGFLFIKRKHQHLSGSKAICFDSFFLCIFVVMRKGRFVSIWETPQGDHNFVCLQPPCSSFSPLFPNWDKIKQRAPGWLGTRLCVFPGHPTSTPASRPPSFCSDRNTAPARQGPSQGRVSALWLAQRAWTCADTGLRGMGTAIWDPVPFAGRKRILPGAGKASQTQLDVNSPHPLNDGSTNVDSKERKKKEVLNGIVPD